MISLLVDNDKLNNEITMFLNKNGYDVVNQKHCMSDVCISTDIIKNDYDDKLILIIDDTENIKHSELAYYSFITPFDVTRLVEVVKQKCDSGKKYVRDIEKVLLKLCLKVNTKGYKYLKKAIEILLIKNDYSLKEVYTEIGAIYNVTPMSIEKSIRYGIETAFDKCDIDDYVEIFGYSINPDKGKPTNKEFIKRICDYVKLKAMRQS